MGSLSQLEKSFISMALLWARGRKECGWLHPLLVLDIVQSFPLLSYCIVSPIYISPICNVDIHYSEKIKKLGILYFSLFTWYQSQERKPNFFLVIVFHSDYLFRRRISFSPLHPPQPLPSAAVRRRHCRRRLPGELFSGRNPHISKRRGPIYTPVASPPESDLPRAVTRVFSPAASPSTRRRVSARVGAWLLLR